MKRIAVIIYGPPGSGKGTQSQLISRAFHLLHFDTGERIREVIYDPNNKDDAVIQKQRTHYYEKGLLCEEWWVFSIVKKAIEELSKVGGMVLSGSPRTVYEAFDEPPRKGTITILEELYGKENIHIFVLKVSGEAAANRNKVRKVCTICRQGYLPQEGCELSFCPICKSPLQVRIDDDPEIMKDRLQEFETRTSPIFEGLRKRGYTVHEIDGELPPYLVFKEITKWLH